MKSVTCIACRKTLSTDEVALNQRLLGMQIGVFYCIDCLAQKLQTTPTRLTMLIARFKGLGCAYFARLMEAESNEKTNDGL